MAMMPAKKSTLNRITLARAKIRPYSASHPYDEHRRSTAFLKIKWAWVGSAYPCQQFCFLFFNTTLATKPGLIRSLRPCLKYSAMGSSQSKVSEEELKAVNTKCKPVRRTYESCLTANNGEPAPCAALETRLVECMAEKLCPQAAEAFRNCVMTSFSLSNAEWSPSACDREAQAMRDSLRKLKVYPLKARTK